MAFLITPSTGYRREDKIPGKHSRLCSCHFREGKKPNGPEIFERNRDKLSTEQRGSPPKKKKTVPTQKTLAEMIEDARGNEPVSIEEEKEERPRKIQEVILEAELDIAKIDFKNLEERLQYKTRCYTDRTVR